MDDKLTFQNIGQSYQFVIKHPVDMARILELDPALWSAVNAPVSSLNANAKFLEYLDSDANGMIRADEAKEAIKWLLEIIASPEVLAQNGPQIKSDEINPDSENGKALLEFIKKELKDRSKDGIIKLDFVTQKIKSISSGAIKGDGVITAPAAGEGPAAALITDIIAVAGGVKNAGGDTGVNAAALDKFLADAKAYLDWNKNTEKPVLPDGKEPGPVYSSFSRLKGKIDEYFSYCEMALVDPANLTRFASDPEKMPELDITSPEKVAEYLKKAPLAKPAAAIRLSLKSGVNPEYQQAATEFADAFAINTLEPGRWAEIKAQLSPYEDYLSKAQGDKTGSLGAEKLEKYLNLAAAGRRRRDSAEVTALRELLTQDGALGAHINHLKSLEKLILFRQHMIRFLNNFVCFSELYNRLHGSMVQAGSLVMDGRHFDLTIKIGDAKEHKKLAVNSNLCMMYLELKKKGDAETTMQAVSAVTSGSVNRIYIGKPGVFIDFEGNYWNAKITDFINGPISFWQSVMLPFRKMSDAASSKIQKLADFNSIEKSLQTSLKTAETQKSTSGFSTGSILMLCGGVGIAALGSAAAFIMKSLEKVSWIKIVSTLTGIVLLIMLPAVISAVLKLRRRNLGQFLESAGWAINLTMRLNCRISSIFTYEPPFPEDSLLLRKDLYGRNATEKPGRLINLMLLVAIIYTIIAAIIFFFMQYR